MIYSEKPSWVLGSHIVKWHLNKYGKLPPKGIAFAMVHERARLYGINGIIISLYIIINKLEISYERVDKLIVEWSKQDVKFEDLPSYEEIKKSYQEVLDLASGLEPPPPIKELPPPTKELPPPPPSKPSPIKELPKKPVTKPDESNGDSIIDKIYKITKSINSSRMFWFIIGLIPGGAVVAGTIRPIMDIVVQLLEMLSQYF